MGVEMDDWIGWRLAGDWLGIMAHLAQIVCGGKMSRKWRRGMEVVDGDEANVKNKPNTISPIKGGNEYELE